jgi:hypothetical protein
VYGVSVAAGLLYWRLALPFDVAITQFLRVLELKHITGA